MKTPQPLQKGDHVAIMCPASFIDREKIERAVKTIEKWGLHVTIGETVGAKHLDFAGSDEMRTQELQEFLDNERIKAIFFARGGYGSARIIDFVSFENFIENPKWLIGFSDVTTIHNHVNQNYSIATIHAVMPSGFEDTFQESIDSLQMILFGKLPRYKFKGHPLNKQGKKEAELIGGNLAIIQSMLGSPSQINTTGKILFIEDVGEKLYNIDRMLVSLKRAGLLSNLAGLLVGGFTHMKGIDFGKSAEEIISEHCSIFDYPIGFNFPAGHQKINKAILFGQKAKLQVKKNKSFLDFR